MCPQPRARGLRTVGTMKLVLIEWLDSHSGHGWHPLDDLAQAAKPVRCQSVGWLVSEANQHKVVVPHISGDQDEGVTPHGRGDITIPNRAIVKMTELPLSGRRRG